jgi:hypothetical protein
MVDFTSTSDGIDDQSKRSAQFLAAIIAQALRDLSISPSGEEKRDCRNYNANAYESLKFFFDQGTPFKHYAFMVGIDPESFIYNLQNRMFVDESPEKKKVPYIHEKDMRVMRARIKWYKIQYVEANNDRPK